MVVKEIEIIIMEMLFRLIFNVVVIVVGIIVVLNRIKGVIL